MSDTPRLEDGYVDFFVVLGLTPEARPGEVRREFKRRMKLLVGDIRRAEITQERRNHFLLEMAQLNAALVVLRDADTREAYWSEREGLIDLEQRWRETDAAGQEDTELLRREFDGRLRGFLSKYIEEMMIGAGRDKECAEACGWDAAHERHASSLLRHYRHSLYQQILERLPYSEVTRPEIDWDERRRLVAELVRVEN
jgi:hypothetical protein